MLRALQIEADEIWKGTNVNGVYDKDPRKHADAQLLTHVRYGFALSNHLAIMDPTSFALAEQYQQTIRIFNIFEQDALIKASRDITFGSRMSC